MDPGDPRALSQDARGAGGHPVRLAERRESPDRTGQVQGEAAERAADRGEKGGGGGGRLHRVFRSYADQPEGGV